MADILEVCAAIQRNLSTLVKQTDQEPFAVQHTEEQSLASEDATRTCWRLCYWKTAVHVPQHPGGHQFEYKPAVSLAPEEGEWYPGLHQAKYYRHGEKLYFSSILSPSKATSGVLCPILISQYQIDMDVPEGVQCKATKMDEQRTGEPIL